MNSLDLQQFMNQYQITAEILTLDGHTPTVEDAARELGVGPELIIKSLVFKARDEPLLVIAGGPSRVDMKKLAAYLGLGRKWVRFAGPEQAEAITGFVVGSMPPFGHRTRLRTLVDSAVLELEEVYGGGGDLNAMLKITSRELLRVVGNEITALSS